jgi:hypothetical protein
MTIAPAIIVGAELGLLLLREFRGYREDLRVIHPDKPLPELKPLPDDIKVAAAEFAKEHGLAQPGGE